MYMPSGSRLTSSATRLSPRSTALLVGRLEAVVVGQDRVEQLLERIVRLCVRRVDAHAAVQVCHAWDISGIPPIDWNTLTHQIEQRPEEWHRALFSLTLSSWAPRASSISWEETCNPSLLATSWSRLQASGLLTHQSRPCYLVCQMNAENIPNNKSGYNYIDSCYNTCHSQGKSDRLLLTLDQTEFSECVVIPTFIVNNL